MRTVRRGKPLAQRSSLRPLVAALGLGMAAVCAQAATYTVTNGAVFGSGSFSEAVNNANTNCGTGPHTIVFAVPSPFVVEMQPFVQLNCAAVTIEGNGHFLEPEPNFFLYGGGCGFESITGQPVLKDLTVRNFLSFPYGGPVGIGLCGGFDAKGVTVTNNGTGIDDNGRALTVTSSNVSGNASSGIVANSGALTVDDTDVNGNVDYGLLVFNGGNVTNNRVALNGTGIFASGTVNVSDNTVKDNVDKGILAADDADVQRNTVFGNTVGIDVEGGIVVDNVVHSNTDYGILINYYTGVIRGNYVGTDRLGATGLGNGLAGISLYFSSPDGQFEVQENTVRGNPVGIEVFCSSNISVDGNFVSLNTNEGIYVGGSRFLTFDGNQVGAAGGNGGNGMTFAEAPCMLIDEAGFAAKKGKGTAGGKRAGGKATSARALIGGLFSEDNVVLNGVIANNGGDGIFLESGINNAILGVSIHSNAGKNINLGFGGGPLPNDPGDGDSFSADGRPNDGQNHPVIASAVQNATSTTVTFTLDSLPGDYVVDLYSNTIPGVPAGTVPETSVNVSITSGPVTATVTLPGAVNNISAVATTSSGGNSSEFSPAVAAVLAPGASITPTSLNFGPVAIGATSPQQTITVKSTGDQPFVISSITDSPSCTGAPICTTGDFICATDCAVGSPYAKNATCTITAKLSPTSPAGPRETRLYVCGNAGSPTELILKGDAVVPPPLAITPGPFDFGNVLVGNRAEQLFFVSNPGSASVPLGAISTGGEFSVVSSSCDVSLASGGSCQVTVAFVPTLRGAASGFLSIASNGVNTTVSLSGTGVQQGVLVLPSAIDLGTRTLGSSAALSTRVDLQNTGNDIVNFSSISVSPPFTLVNECPSSLPVGASCSLFVQFGGNSIGEFSGTLTLLTDARGGSGSVPLIARVQAVPQPDLRVSPSSIGFGARLAGTTGASQRVTVTNVGGATAILDTSSIDIDFIVAGSSCGATLSPQATCFVDIALRPVGFGARRGLFSLPSNATGSPHTVSLSGTGCRPVNGSNRLGVNLGCQP